MPGTLRPIRECPKAELHICWLLPPRLVSRLSIARRLLSRCRGNPYSERPCNSKAAIKGTRERERWPNQRRVRLSKTCQGPCGLSELSLNICWLHPPRRRQRRYFALSPSQNRGIPYSDGLGRSTTARSSTASQPGWGEGEWKASGRGVGRGSWSVVMLRLVRGRGIESSALVVGGARLAANATSRARKAERLNVFRASPCKQRWAEKVKIGRVWWTQKSG